MEHTTTGLIVLGSITAVLVFLAIALNLGKKYHKEDEAKKSSLGKC